MIEVDDDGNGIAEVWLETHAGRWILLARGENSIGALVDAEKLIRDELNALQARLHNERETTRRRA